MIIAFLLSINNSCLSSKASRLDLKWPQIWINLIFKLCHLKEISIIVSSNSNNLQLSNNNNNSNNSPNSSNKFRTTKTMLSRLAIIIVSLMLQLITTPIWLMPPPSKAEGRDLRTYPNLKRLKICKYANNNSPTCQLRKKQIWKRS